jgi:hypothetical protein
MDAAALPTGSAALPWWVDALLILIALVIVITLVVLATEVVRNIGAGRRGERRPVDPPQLAAPSANGGDQA